MAFRYLGRYRLESEIGRGAMGRVWLAHDPELDRHVALKTVSVFGEPEGDAREAARDRFLREARAAARLNHPGIVIVHDVGTHDGVPYLAMERLEGPTLAVHGKGGTRLAPVEAVTLVAAAAEALAFAHARGVVHGDVKPANLVRVGPGRIKILDFGLARMLDSDDGKGLHGTPNYMTPEQVRGEKLDARTDLFSLAAVLFELLTGEKPFPGDSVSSILYRVVHESPPTFAEVGADLPRELERFLFRALSKRPDDRFRDGNSFARALRDAWTASTSPAPAVPATGGGAEDPLGLHEPVPEAELPAPAVTAPVRPRRGRVFGVLTALAVFAAVAVWQREPLRAWAFPEPAPLVFEVAIETDPPGLPVTVDGKAWDGGSLTFSEHGPFPVVETRSACREVRRELGPGDAGGTVVLVPEPARAEIRLDPGVSGARAERGDERVSLPADLALDLCEEQRWTIRAPGRKPAQWILPAGATPLEARTSAAELTLESVPRGRLVLEGGLPYPATATLDGKRIPPGNDGLALAPGRYTVRFSNPDRWLDVRRTVTIEPDATTRLDAALPGLATLTVQAFPATADAWLRRPGGDWRRLDEVPVTHDVAAGAYEVKVVSKTTGESRTSNVTLERGDNPPVRISFARSDGG